MIALSPARRGDQANPPPGSPTVFVRTLSAPPGLPWDQGRIADLDARAGAPLPIGDVVYQVRRLEPWRPGRASRYFVCYVRARDAGDRLETTAVVDGRAVAIEFLSPAERARRLRRSGILAGAAGAAAILVLGAILSAVTARSAAIIRMEQINQAVEARARRLRATAALKAQTRALDRAHARGMSVADFLSDVAWASRAKATGAHIDALHWDHGYIGVETRGDAPPFGSVDRLVAKAEKPLRPGVWLWGVAPAGSRAGAMASPPSTGAPP